MPKEVDCFGETEGKTETIPVLNWVDSIHTCPQLQSTSWVEECRPDSTARLWKLTQHQADCPRKKTSLAIQPLPSGSLAKASRKLRILGELQHDSEVSGVTWNCRLFSKCPVLKGDINAISKGRVGHNDEVGNLSQLTTKTPVRQRHMKPGGAAFLKHSELEKLAVARQKS